MKAVDFSFVSRRNDSLPAMGRRVVVASLACIAFFISMLFISEGAWVVALFLFLAVAGLHTAFQYLGRCSGDFDEVTVRDDRIFVTTRSAGRYANFECNRYWARLAVERAAGVGTSMLVLHSGGKRIAFGAHLNSEEQASLAFCLRRILAARQAFPANGEEPVHQSQSHSPTR